MSPLLVQKSGYSICEGRHVRHLYAVPPSMEQQPISIWDFVLSPVTIPINLTAKTIRLVRSLTR